MKEILIYAQIGDTMWDEGVSAGQIKAELDEADGEDVNVRINSAGGSVFEGYAIYSLLKDYKGKVTIIIDSLCASIASVIAMAGDEIQIADNGMVMIHNPMGGAFGGSDEMRKTANLLDKIQLQIMDTYAKRTGLDQETIAKMMAEETWFNATEAMQYHFADSSTGLNSDMTAKIDVPWIKTEPKNISSDSNVWTVAIQKRRLQLATID